MGSARSITRIFTRRRGCGLCGFVEKARDYTTPTLIFSCSHDRNPITTLRRMVLFINAFMWLGKQMVSSTPTADSIIFSCFVARERWLGFYFFRR